MKCDKCGYSDNGSGDWAHACGPVAIQRQPVANERIRELINEATSFKEGDTEGKYDIEVFDKEKFAESIIRECMRMCDCADVSYLEHGCDKEASGAAGAKEIIKEWFGVEE